MKWQEIGVVVSMIRVILEVVKLICDIAWKAKKKSNHPGKE